MLFSDEKLKSVFDFGSQMPRGLLSISDLCKEIARIAGLIAEMIANDKKILLLHGDISSPEKYISICKAEADSLFERDEIALHNIIYRKSKGADETHTAISIHLEELGISEPPQGSAEYFKYLQLLYFFYMMRYYVYPKNNIFLILKEDRRSTYFVPDKRAAGGDYWYFILSNLFDDHNMADLYRLYDLGFSARISSLVITLEEKISEKNTHSQNIDAAEKIESIIARFNSESEVKTYATLCNPVVQMMEIAYRYHMLAYSGDMIKNLGGEHSPFRFDELEFELPLTWQNRLIKLSEIQEFFKEEDTLTFCFQKKMDCPRPEKAIRGNAFSFVSNLIEFEQSLIEDGQQRLFTVAYNNEIYIPADRAALIVKTYLDLDLQEKLKMKYYNGSDWKSEQSLKRALSPANKLATDLAMRLFIVAFHSEYLNAHQGYGYYWPLFKCIYLSQYLLLQKIVFACFSGVNQEEWIRRFKDIQDNISRI